MEPIKKILTPKDFKAFKLIYDQQGNLQTDLELLNILKAWRSEAMKKNRLPSTYIFYNSCLVAFATYYPQTREEFLRIAGVGVRKWERFGITVAQIISDYVKNLALGIDDTVPF